MHGSFLHVATQALSRLRLTIRRTLPPRIAGFDLAGTSLFRYRLGGDYHDFLPGESGDAVTVVVGDVAGHDGAAAALMAMVRGRLRAGGIAPGRLAPLMAVLNRELADRASGGRFMTLFLSVLTAETRSIHWVSAGHGPVLSYDPGEDHFREIPGEDIPLGIDRHWRFHEQAHRGWSDGALLVVGTDGITEARNPGGEMYGLERLLQAVRIHCRRSAAEIVAAVMADQAAFRGGRPQGDDVTLVVVKAV